MDFLKINVLVIKRQSMYITIIDSSILKLEFPIMSVQNLTNESKSDVL